MSTSHMVTRQLNKIANKNKRTCQDNKICEENRLETESSERTDLTLVV